MGQRRKLRIAPDARQAAADRAAGLAWWKGLTRLQRADALYRADADGWTGAWAFEKERRALYSDFADVLHPDEYPEV